MALDDYALEYHEEGRPGKITIWLSKPCMTQRDLSLRVHAGGGCPYAEDQRRPGTAFRYTARGNLVAVVTNGTAVLGLGNLGPWPPNR